MGYKFYVSFVLFIVIGHFLYAQNDIYQFAHLDITNGLSDNQVNSIIKDQKGFMWFGTTSGLNRYDGYKFRVFKHDAKDTSSIRENHVLRISEGPGKKLWIFTHSAISIYDPSTEKFSSNVKAELSNYKVGINQLLQVKKGAGANFWFITNRRGLYHYKPQLKSTIYYSSSSVSKIRLHSDDVVDLISTTGNLVWLLYSDGVIEQADLKLNKIVQRYDGVAKANAYKETYYQITRDNNQNLWIYSGASPVGVYYFNTTAKSLMHFGKDTPGNKLNSNVINSIVQADDGNVWLGTDHGGVNVVNPETYKVTFVLRKEDDPKSLSGNSVNLYKDNTGIIWAGTFKQGVNYYHKGVMQFPLYRHFSTDAKSLPYEDINGFAEEKGGNLWIATNGGGLLYLNRQTNTYKRYKHDAANPNSLTNDIIVKLFIDHTGKLWIGTYFGGLDCFDGKNFIHYRHNDAVAGSISDDRIYSIMEDSKLNLWVGTFAGGLNVLDRKTNTFKHPKYAASSEYTSVIYEDRQHNIWIGRDKGVDVIENGTNSIWYYYSKLNNPNSLIGNDVNVLTQDSRGLMWIGTKDGLSILNTQKNTFLNIEEGINLPANNVSNIIEDKQGKMWVSTTNGLAKITLSVTGGKYKVNIDNYNESDGLQGRLFNLNAALKLRTGEIAFGGSHGFNLFNPALIRSFEDAPSLTFTDFKLFNKSVAVGDTIYGKVVLKQSVTETKALTLEHNQNVFDIEFATGHFFNPDKVRFQYMLEGFDKDWTTSIGNNRKATYTNLDGGEYTFKVRTLNSSNVSQGNQIALKITVLPPFFKTPLAYAVYFMLIVGGLLYLRHRGIRKLQQEFETKQAKIEDERKLEAEREEARRMHQLDLLKIKFFTNISHEFRTPLSLILSPIDDLIKTADKPDEQRHLDTIKKNGKRLLNLVNQLLDFRKMEYNELKLCLKKGDIVKFIKEVSSSFNDVAHQKQIQFIIESELCAFATSFDYDKIERILFNLLSNAFKFTPSGGHISVMLRYASSKALPPGKKMLEIKVIDTGIGIPKEKHEKVFDRFFQDNTPDNLLNQGSGIGLSITREFVKMHGGAIQIESEPGYGTCFTISIPLQMECITEAIIEEPQQDEVFSIFNEDEVVVAQTKKPTILLIEDNDDLRVYLKENLKHCFHIIEAVNGKDGWQKALAMHPRLIVSDISMPEMNGVELCKKIKSDSRTAQIPVILLTALITEEDQLTGLGSGANDYILKPFNFEILLSKINNLLQMQQILKKTYQKQVEVEARDINIVSEDEKFLNSAFEYIELNITNLNFSVEELSSHLNLSRVSLYKKLLTLTGKTPVDCIRTIRLKRAVQLLEKSKLSIANVAYEVGFNNAAYFAKVFKEEYGITPSEYILKNKNKELVND